MSFIFAVSGKLDIIRFLTDIKGICSSLFAQYFIFAIMKLLYLLLLCVYLVFAEATQHGKVIAGGGYRITELGITEQRYRIRRHSPKILKSPTG